MAIDNAEKRRSAAGVAFWVVGPGVTPNAAKDVEWRQQSAWSYSGISPNPPVPGINAIERFGLGQKRSFSDALELGGGGW